jgi:hypothetical protein
MTSYQTQVQRGKSIFLPLSYKSFLMAIYIALCKEVMGVSRNKFVINAPLKNVYSGSSPEKHTKLESKSSAKELASHSTRRSVSKTH